MTVISRFIINPAARGTSANGINQLTLGMKVNDFAVQQRLHGFDGLERPFALVPSERDGQVTWWRHELQFKRVLSEGLTYVDDFESAPVTNVDRAAGEKYGVAFGMETNRCTVWNQVPGQNEPVLWK